MCLQVHSRSLSRKDRRQQYPAKPKWIRAGSCNNVPFFVNVHPMGLVLHWVRKHGEGMQRTLLLIHKHAGRNVGVPGCAGWMNFHVKPDRTPQTSWMLEQAPSLALAVELCHKNFQKHWAYVTLWEITYYCTFCSISARVNLSSVFNASRT